LYQVDPSGSYFSWKASAMGKNVSNAKTFLEKRYVEDRPHLLAKCCCTEYFFENFKTWQAGCLLPFTFT